MLKKIKTQARDWVVSSRKRFLGDKSSKKLTMCKKCFTFYYRNSWHFDKPMVLETDRDEEIPVQFTKCNACLDQESIFYEVESQPDFTLRGI